MAFDSLSGNAAMTVNVASACASLIMSGTYAGTFTYNSTLTLTSTITHNTTCTIAGTAGTLICSGSATLTSGGKTLTCAMSLIGTNTTFTLADDWTVNGLTTIGASGTNTVNGVGRKITCVGGFTHAGATATIAGTAKLSLTGGTWSQVSSSSCGIDVDLAGNVTVSGLITWGASGKTLKYVSGTITVSGSTLKSVAACTYDTVGMTWVDVSLTNGFTLSLASNFAHSGTFSTTSAAYTFSGAGTLVGPGSFTPAGNTITLSNTGGINTTGTLTWPNAACTFAGTAGFTVGTMTTATLTASRIHTLTQGNTYTVTTALSNVGTTSAIRQAIISSSAGNKVVFTLTPGASCNLLYCDPTDVDSNGGALIVSINGVVTTSFNWTGSFVTPTGTGIGKIFTSSIIGGVS